MSILRLGATKQYSDNWENIFTRGSRKASAKKTSAKATSKSPKKSAKRSKVAAKSGAKKRVGAAKRKSR